MKCKSCAIRVAGDNRCKHGVLNTEGYSHVDKVCGAAGGRPCIPICSLIVGDGDLRMTIAIHEAEINGAVAGDAN